MIIPELSESPRYYLAVSEKEAYASYETLEEAQDCISSLKLYNLLDLLEKIVGVIKVESDGAKWVNKL